jgi:hypothetical protein
MEQDSYKDFDTQIECNLKELLARMTRAEKVMQMMQININHHGRAQLEARIYQGVGSILNMNGVNCSMNFRK